LFNAWKEGEKAGESGSHRAPTGLWTLD
jgi:hypothetical protein